MSAAAEVGLQLSGLRCAGCASKVEEKLRRAAGVVEATVNFTNHRALVRFDTAATSVDDLVSAVGGLGYDATPYDPDLLDRPADREARAMLVRLLVSAFLAMNVMWLAIALYLGDDLGMAPDVRRILRWVATALSLPAVTWCAAPFWRGAIGGLRRGQLTIDVPIILGVGTAFATQVVGTVGEARHLYVDSAAVIVFLILLGRTLERRARSRASQALDRLRAMAPKQALRVGEGGRIEPVAPEALRVGDRIHVPLGEACPVDGRIEGDAVETDESLLSGESAPVVRPAGAWVPAGARVVAGDARLIVEARAHEGTLARIASLLERATASRPRVQRIADRVAAHFAPAVLVVAALAAGIAIASGATALETALRATAVLIVACPCALGLATPAAVTAAIGRAAQLGILVKSGEALERLAGVDTILLDKTGTLTEGELMVQEVVAAPGIEAAALLALAARAEGRTTHPIARAIHAAAGSTESDEPTQRRTIPGLGVAADHGGETTRVGRRALLESEAIAVPEALAAKARELESAGASLAWVARGDRALGVIAFADRDRPDAAESIRALRALGLAVGLVSGDHEAAAERAAGSAGITSVIAGATPEEKVAAVAACRAAGERVVFVGDGVNDAGALRAADVGIAMVRGSDVTIHAADLVVHAPRLGALVDAVRLARACRSRIHEGLGLALAYNALAVPLAMAGFLLPLHAAIAMSLSSVVVTLNAIRLLGFAGSGTERPS